MNDDMHLKYCRNDIEQGHENTLQELKEGEVMEALQEHVDPEDKAQVTKDNHHKDHHAKGLLALLLEEEVVAFLMEEAAAVVVIPRTGEVGADAVDPLPPGGVEVVDLLPLVVVAVEEEDLLPLAAVYGAVELPPINVPGEVKKEILRMDTAEEGEVIHQIQMIPRVQRRMVSRMVVGVVR